MTFQFLLISLNGFLALTFMFFQSKKNRYFLNPIHTYWVTIIYFSVVQPAGNLMAYNERFGTDSVNFALIGFSVSSIFVYFGNRVDLGVKIARAIPKIRSASQQRLGLLAIVFLILGISLTYVMIRAYGGWVLYFSRTNLRLLEVDISDYLALGPRICIFAVMVGLATSVYYRRRVFIIMYFTISALLLLWFIYHGSRSSVISLSVIILGSFYAPRMKSPSLVLIVSALILGFILIGFIGAYRTQFTDPHFWEGGVAVSEAVANSIGFLTRSGNQGASSVSINEDFGMAVAALSVVPEQLGFEHGYMFLQVFTQFIPSVIWHGKIYPDGESWHAFHLVANTSQYMNSAGFLAGPAPTIVGKYYYSWGIIGLVIAPFFSGCMLKAIWCYCNLLPANIRTLFIVSCAPIGFMEANNPALWLTFWLPTAGVTLAIVLIFSRTRARRRKR